MFSGVRSVVTVNALVTAATVVGLVNNILIAAAFGLTRRVDAYFAAMVLPSLFMILCVDYLGKNFLPILAVAKEDSEVSASKMTSTVITMVSIAALFVTALLVAFSEQLFMLLLPGFDQADTQLAKSYFLIMAPAIVLMAVTAFHEYVCQYDEKFSTIVSIRMALPIMNLATIVALGPVVGEYCLPIGFLLGQATVFVLMARSARYSFVPSFDIRPNLEKKVFVNSAILMSTGFIARTRSIVINVLGSTLGDGAIAALALAMKLTEPLERCAFTGARMFMFSRTARLYAQRNESEIGNAYATGLRVSFLLLAPVLWWVGMNGQTIVDLFFARGAFTAEMSLIVAAALVGMTPAVLFQGVNQILANAFYATGRIWVPATTMPFGMLIFVAAAVPLTGLLQTQGLALAMSVTSVVVFLILFVGLSVVLKTLRFWSVLAHLIAYGMLAGLTMYVVMRLLHATELQLLPVAAIALPIGLAIHVGVLALAGDRTVGELQRHAREAWRSRWPMRVASAHRDP